MLLHLMLTRYSTTLRQDPRGLPCGDVDVVGTTTGGIGALQQSSLLAAATRDLSSTRMPVDGRTQVLSLVDALTK